MSKVKKKPGRKASGQPPEEAEEPLEEEEASDLESSFLNDQGSGAVSHGRRVRGRGLDERELHELPDEPPPGYLDA